MRLVQKRAVYLALVVGVLLAGSASAAKRYTVFDPEVDFSAYRTYAWRAHGEFESEAGPRIRYGGNEALQRKGLRQVRPEDGPDVWIEYMVGSNEMLRDGFKVTASYSFDEI